MFNLEEFIEDQQFIRQAGDFYECPGMHVWHEDDVEKLYDEYVEEYKKGRSLMAHGPEVHALTA